VARERRHTIRQANRPKETLLAARGMKCGEVLSVVIACVGVIVAFNGTPARGNTPSPPRRHRKAGRHCIDAAARRIQHESVHYSQLRDNRACRKPEFRSSLLSTLKQGDEFWVAPMDKSVRGPSLALAEANNRPLQIQFK
jgi:hypothetical protein